MVTTVCSMTAGAQTAASPPAETGLAAYSSTRMGFADKNPGFAAPKKQTKKKKKKKKRF